jgi:endogenous inhibitor of DNA gyrase (YacG/DUF329 family)
MAKDKIKYKQHVYNCDECGKQFTTICKKWSVMFCSRRCLIINYFKRWWIGRRGNV